MAAGILAAGSVAGDGGDFITVNNFARRTGWLHPFMTAYASTAGAVAVFTVLMIVGWWLARRSGRMSTLAAAAWTPIGALIALGFNQLIVHAVNEPRPYAALSHIEVLVSRSSDPAFASDHAVAAGAIAVGLLYVNRRLGTLAAGLALLLAFARVYVGAHYPHDVVAGLLLGAAVIVVGRSVAHPLLTRLAGPLTRTRLRPLLMASPAETRDPATLG